MFELGHVALNDPHVVAHNAERDKINELVTLVDSGRLSDSSIYDTIIEQPEAKIARALRNFHMSLPTIGTTAVDVMIGPSDSIGEGAWADKWLNTFPRIVQDRLRRAVQPPGVKGGMGYSGAGSPAFLAGQPWQGFTGTTTQDFTKGLGLKSIILSAGATWVGYFTGTKADIFYRKVSGGGTFTVSVDSGAASPSQNTAGAGLGTYSTATMSEALHSIVITASGGPVTITGGFFYNGDTSAGLRVWEAGHSGYSTLNYINQQGWLDDLAIIPNLKLVILPIGSNDYYAGYTPAATKVRIQNLITLIRAHMVTTLPSFALVSYYDRPAPLASAPWSDFVKMYREVADADPEVMHIDLGSTFGPLLSNTDGRGGLTTAVPGDYVHPTTAGHRVLGEYIASKLIPIGGASAGIDSRVIPTDVKAAEGDGHTYLDLGDVSAGALTFVVTGLISTRLRATGNISLAAAAMPPVPAGRTASFLMKFVQDATGGRILTLTGISYVGGYAPLVDIRPNTSSLLKFFYDGAGWWCIPINDWDEVLFRSATQTISLPGIAGAASFAAFNPLNGFIARCVMTGAVTLSTSGMPPTLAGRSSRFIVRWTQDATGGRTLTHTSFLYDSALPPKINLAPNASTLLEYTYDGANWWVHRLNSSPATVVNEVVYDMTAWVAMGGNPANGNIGSTPPLRTVAKFFDPDAAEFVGSTIRIPEGWSGVTAKLIWATTTGATGDVAWRLHWRLSAAGESVTSTPSNTGLITAASGASGLLTTVTLGTGLAMNAGSNYLLQLERVAADAADTLTVDAAAVSLVLSNSGA